MNNYFLAAKILRPHGIRGEVKVSPLADWLDFSTLSDVYVGKNLVRTKILGVKPLNGFFVLKLDGINDIDAAEGLRDSFVQIIRAEYPQFFTDALFSQDIVGFYVFDESGEKIGVVTRAEEYPSATILTISSDGMNYSVPMIEDVLALSADRTKIIVNRKRFDEVKV